MCLKKSVALRGAMLALLLTPALAGAKGTTVGVRIEGVKKTLLAPKNVKTHGGWIRKGGTPRRACPATSAAGALDVATHHRWGGKFEKSLGLEVTSILGERHTFSSRYFWEIFLNNKPASVGACGLRLHHGDHLLFAAALISSPEDLIAIRAPQHATAGQPFLVKVVWLNARGTPHPLAGAHVHVGGKTVTSNSKGLVRVTSTTPGTIVLHADRTGYIRAAPARVRVSS